VSSGHAQVVKAMAVIRRPRDGALLVSEDANPAGALFHRPLGGHVEFGEYAEHAVRRELLEEIGQSLSEVKLLGVLENIFDWAGSRAHESCSCSPPRSRTTRRIRSPSSASSTMPRTTIRSFAGGMRMPSARRSIQMALPTSFRPLCCQPKKPS
jgi:hypothetical protein